MSNFHRLGELGISSKQIENFETWYIFADICLSISAFSYYYTSNTKDNGVIAALKLKEMGFSLTNKKSFKRDMVNDEWKIIRVRDGFDYAFCDVIISAPKKVLGFTGEIHIWDELCNYGIGISMVKYLHMSEIDRRKNSAKLICQQSTIFDNEYMPSKNGSYDQSIPNNIIYIDIQGSTFEKPITITFNTKIVCLSNSYFMGNILLTFIGNTLSNLQFKNCDFYGRSFFYFGDNRSSEINFNQANVYNELYFETTHTNTFKFIGASLFFPLTWDCNNATKQTLDLTNAKFMCVPSFISYFASDDICMNDMSIHTNPLAYWKWFQNLFTNDITQEKSTDVVIPSARAFFKKSKLLRQTYAMSLPLVSIVYQYFAAKPELTRDLRNLRVFCETMKEDSIQYNLRISEDRTRMATKLRHGNILSIFFEFSSMLVHMIYGLLSNYGRNWQLPIFWLILIWHLFSNIYGQFPKLESNYIDSLSLITTMIPLLSSGLGFGRCQERCPLK